MEALLVYYIFVFVFAGVIGSLVLVNEFDLPEEGFLKTVFMYQYAVYMCAKDEINIAGIIILEILTTFSVWFLNIIIVIIYSLIYALMLVCNMFYFIFKRRDK